jgi:rhodanese-related sulfurtransferase
VTHRALAAIAIVLGALAPFAGSPYRVHPAPFDVRQLAAQVAHEEDHVTAVELAAWIKDRKPGLRIIDLRSPAEFAQYHVPTAEQMPLETLVASPRFAKDETVVLISDGGAHAAQAWVFLRALGHEHVYFLRGGLGEWLDEVMNPPKTTALSRYFSGTARGSGGDASGEDTADTVAKMRRRGC